MRFFRDPGLRQRCVLHAVTAVVLGWVSYGSHEVLVWIGIPWWPAWIYPAIVDLAVLYVTPFAVNAELPDDQRWPLRRHAKMTRAWVVPLITIFNVLHMILVVQGMRIAAPDPRLQVATQAVAYLIAVLAGFTPVWLYVRVVHLEIMHKAWELSERHAADAASRAAAEAEAREAREREARLADELAREEARERARLAREDRVPSQRGTAKRSRVTETPGHAVNDVKQQVTAAGKSSGQALDNRIMAAWAAGHEPNPRDVARELGMDPSGGNHAVRRLRKRGLLPPSERRLQVPERPQLALANG